MGRLLLTSVSALLAAGLLTADALAGRCGSNPCRSDMSVSGHAEPQPIKRGELTELKLTAQNNGPDGALAAELQAVVPAALAIQEIRVFGGHGCTRSGTFVQCKLGDLASQQQAVVRIKVRGTRQGTFVTQAKVYAYDIDDPNGGNGQVGATVLVNGTARGGADGAAGTIRALYSQRIRRTGGVNVRVTPSRSGRLAVRGEVLNPRGGRIPLVGVIRGGARAGREERVFLGVTPANLQRIAAAIRVHRRLRVVVRATIGDSRSRKDLQVR